MVLSCPNDDNEIQNELLPCMLPFLASAFTPQLFHVAFKRGVDSEVKILKKLN